MKFPEHCDLIVVGGGIAGLATAYFYKRAFPGHEVLVLERDGRCVGAGQTGRSGGHLLPGFEGDYSVVERLLGRQQALELYRITLDILDEIIRIIREENIECGARDGYWMIGQGHDVGLPEEFMLPRRLLGLPEPHACSGPELKRRVNIAGYETGFYFPRIPSIDPPKFIYGLAEALIRRGGHVALGHEYESHGPIQARPCGKARSTVCLKGGQTLYTRRLVLAGGDGLTRHNSFMQRRTFTVYTGRLGVPLSRENFRTISPPGLPLAGCDSKLKSNANAIDADSLWVSLRGDGYLVVGYGGCLGGRTSEETGHNVNCMTGELYGEFYRRFPSLRNGSEPVRLAIGGLSTSTNLLPFLGPVSDQAYAIGAQSGVGLGQSVLMAKALVNMWQGCPRIYQLLNGLSDGQSIIPTRYSARKAAMEVGKAAIRSPSTAVRRACRMVCGAAVTVTRAITPQYNPELRP